MPEKLAEIMDKKEHFTTLANDYNTVKDFIVTTSGAT